MKLEVDSVVYGRFQDNVGIDLKWNSEDEFRAILKLFDVDAGIFINENGVFEWNEGTTFLKGVRTLARAVSEGTDHQIGTTDYDIENSEMSYNLREG
jgi:hypothetical protein